MAMPNPYAQYQQQSILTASPQDLTLMLYNGCIKFLKQAELAIEQKDIAGSHAALQRAQDIVLEFMSTLDMQYEVSHSLMPLYDYIHRRMIEGNIKKDASIVKECIDLVSELRDTWVEAVRLNRGQSR